LSRTGVTVLASPGASPGSAPPDIVVIWPRWATAQVNCQTIEG
jgi:hypothetical protein